MVSDNWGSRNRDGIAVVLGTAMLIVLTAYFLITGEAPDRSLIGAGLALFGLGSVLQYQKDKGG